MSQSSMTSRQRFWVDHLQACSERGQKVSSYAAEQALGASAMYKARSSLRRRGLWPPPGATFVRARPATPSAAMPMYRVTLPNGVVVETAGGTVEAVLAAAARLS